MVGFGSKAKTAVSSANVAVHPLIILSSTLYNIDTEIFVKDKLKKEPKGEVEILTTHMRLKYKEENTRDKIKRGVRM
jgi:hypothetical protein